MEKSVHIIGDEFSSYTLPNRVAKIGPVSQWNACLKISKTVWNSSRLEVSLHLE